MKATASDMEYCLAFSLFHNVYIIIKKNKIMMGRIEKHWELSFCSEIMLPKSWK